jgi:BolA family transcriptional regulator, general stress-responsive regulator
MGAADLIAQKLTAAFSPSELSVEDESARHAGHAGARPEGETHFRVYIVSRSFEGLSRVERHRQINKVLADEVRTNIHALTITALAPQESK